MKEKTRKRKKEKTRERKKERENNIYSDSIKHPTVYSCLDFPCIFMKKFFWTIWFIFEHMFKRRY